MKTHSNFESSMTELAEGKDTNSVTVNKVIDRQNLRSLGDNKLTMTFDRVTIFGNNLSASFGMVVKKNKK